MSLTKTKTSIIKKPKLDKKHKIIVGKKTTKSLKKITCFTLSDSAIDLIKKNSHKYYSTNSKYLDTVIIFFHSNMNKAQFKNFDNMMVLKQREEA